MAKPGTLKVDHHVVSADGTRYLVRYVWTPDGQGEQADLAEVTADGSWHVDGERVTLPTAELRRVTATTLPPITGMPETRPRCVMCDRPLKPWTDHERAKRPGGSSTSHVVARVFRGWRGYPASRTDAAAMFCTHSCEGDFARAAFKAGYRIVRKKEQ